MALFNRIDLIAYCKLLELQLAILPLSPVLNKTQKELIAVLYKELIAIISEAIAEQTEVTEYEVI